MTMISTKFSFVSFDNDVGILMFHFLISTSPWNTLLFLVFSVLVCALLI